jgi:hypothetical protein
MTIVGTALCIVWGVKEIVALRDRPENLQGWVDYAIYRTPEGRWMLLVRVPCGNWRPRVWRPRRHRSTIDVGESLLRESRKRVVLRLAVGDPDGLDTGDRSCRFTFVASGLKSSRICFA